MLRRAAWARYPLQYQAPQNLLAIHFGISTTIGSIVERSEPKTYISLNQLEKTYMVQRTENKQSKPSKIDPIA